MRLDITRRYEFQDSQEVSWRFSFDEIGGEEGWWAWVKRPEASSFFCVGKISDQDLIKKLESAPPLTQDDLIDLEMWLTHNGLDKYKPKQRRKKKEEIVE